MVESICFIAVYMQCWGPGVHLPGVTSSRGPRAWIGVSRVPFLNPRGFPPNPQVSQHKSRDKGIWVTYKDGVYDVSDFIQGHPGGPEKIMMGKLNGI